MGCIGRQEPCVGVREYTVLEDCIVYSHFEVPINTFNNSPLLSSVSLNAEMGTVEVPDEDVNKTSSCSLFTNSLGDNSTA